MKKKSGETRVARIRGASTQRRERQKQELRHSILEAAGEEFLEHGYENFSLRRVAERIGYSPTTIYLHFQNKDDLLLATVQDGFESFDRKMEAAAHGSKDPLKRIEALGRAYIAFGLRHPALYRLMFMQRSDFYFMPRLSGVNPSDNSSIHNGNPHNGSTPAVTTDEPAILRITAQALLIAAVQEGMKKGLLRRGDPLIVADALWAGAHGLVSLANSPLMSPDHAQRVSNLLLNTLIRGIQPQK